MLAYQIRTPRLLLRCWTVADAPRVVAAIESSLEYLREWMDWAHLEPESVETKAQRIRGWNTRFIAGEDFVYGLFNHEETEVIGAVGLHRRIGAGAAEIGYWIHVDHAGRGLGTEAAGAVTRVGFEVLGLQRIEIHCDPANKASAAIPRKLGYRHHVTIADWVASPKANPRDTMIWTMLRDDFPASTAAAAEIEALDEAGHPAL